MKLDIQNIPEDMFYDVQKKILKLLVSEGLHDIETFNIENCKDEMIGYSFEIK